MANIAELVDRGTITGVADVRDESDRSGMRVVVEARRGSAPEVCVLSAQLPALLAQIIKDLLLNRKQCRPLMKWQADD